MQIPELIEALTIIAKQEPDADISAAHDQIWAGEYNPDKHTEEDRARLEKLRWFEDCDAWSHFV